MDELLGEFLTETNESLSQLDQDLVKLEKNPEDPALLSNIFRVMHTVKGTCGFLGLPRLEKVAHHGEDVLGKFRDGIIPVDEEAVSLVLESLDRIRDLVESLEQTGEEPVGDDKELVKKIEDFIERRTNGEAPAEKSESTEEAAADEKPTEETPAEESEAEEGSNLNEDGIDFTPIKAEDTASAVDDLREKGELDVSGAGQVAEKKEEKKEDQKGAAKDGKKDASLANQTIRVSVELLENLMTVASELVLTRNQLIQLLRQENDSPFSTPLQRLNHNVTELQEHVMKTRMQPIGNAWAKLPRIVRDLANELDKDIDLVMEGEETELDRQVLELIKDPLTHMVRNSADHGLESTVDRKMLGKPEKGTILLKAFHEGGHIIIEISDDGKGLPIDKIKQKAIANGLASEEELDGYSPQQIHNLIFRPGFSTAEKVTSVSGRGVGMDVVKSNIEKIGGTVDLSSQAGKGTKFQVKIPLTLAIVSALIVESSSERFAIPQISVVELVRTSESGDNRIEEIQGSPVLRLRNRLLPLVSLSKLLKLEGGKELKSFSGHRQKVDEMKKKQAGANKDGKSIDMAALEKEALALQAKIDKRRSSNDDSQDSGEDVQKIMSEEQKKLAEMQAMIEKVQKKKEQAEKTKVDAPFGREASDIPGLQAAIDSDDDEPYIIVTQVGNYSFGIIVDQVYDTEEIVVKPVSPILRHISMFSGNTILGDGSVIMILDPNGIAQSTGEVTVADEDALAAAEKEKKRFSSDNTTSLLVFKAGSGAPKAVPLSLIGRLEDFEVKEIEESDNGRHVIQYRGELMPLVPFAKDHAFPEDGRQAVLVFSDEKSSMGLMVDEIVDIVEEKMNVQTSAETAGILGSAIISGKATNVIDVGYYLNSASNDWFHVARDGAFESDGLRRILLVDDSPFFRNMLRPLLEVAGYRVEAAGSGQEVLDLMEENEHFDIIVSDIEMPGLNGFELAEKVRSHEKWKDVPLIALSSHATSKDMERGRQVGFDDYVAKFDRDALIEAIGQALAKHTGEAA